MIARAWRDVMKRAVRWASVAVLALAACGSDGSDWIVVGKSQEGAMYCVRYQAFGDVQESCEEGVRGPSSSPRIYGRTVPSTPPPCYRDSKLGEPLPGRCR